MKLEPDQSFYHAWLKIKWAEERINHVDAFRSKFLKTYEEEPLLRVDHEAGKVILDFKSIHPAVSLIAGDAIFSLRSALDCCWMGLRRAIGAKASKKTLPRGDTRKEVECILGKAAMENSFKGINSLILDTIKPYKDGGNEPLWYIAQLDNWNKHNMLITAVQQTEVVQLRYRTSALQFGLYELNKHISNQPMTIIRFPPGGDITFYDEPHLSVDIVLISRKPEDERLLLPFLWTALKETNQAVEFFRALFGNTQKVRT